MFFVVLLLFINFIQLVHGQVPSHFSFINCTWPCSNPTDKCVITSNSASCRPSTTNDEWIMNSPTRAPVYTGPSVTIPAQSCISVPIPQLPIANLNDTPPIGQTIIYWPITNTTRKVQDEYLGNCGRSLYCYKSVCFDHLNQGSRCNSSNQCAYGICDNSTCHSWSNDSRRRSDSKTTVAVVASVFSVIGALMLSGIVYRHRAFLFRTKEQKVIVQADADKLKGDNDSPPPYEP